MIALCLVLPDGLSRLSVEAGTRGWFEGYGIEGEVLAVALTSRVAEGVPPLQDPIAQRLLDHYAVSNGQPYAQLLHWVVVKPGFGQELVTGQIWGWDGLAAWTQDGLPLDSQIVACTSICCLEPRGKEVATHLAIVLEDGCVLSGNIQLVFSEPAPSQLLDALGPIEHLRGKRVSIVGLGSGGSVIAVHLAAAGVGALELFDRDRLTMANLFRHACDMRHVGQHKVNAVREVIRYHDLSTEVVSHSVDVVRNADEMWKAMQPTDLVVCATDNRISRRLVNYICVRTETPLVMACTFHAAQIGEIIRVLPGRSACYECTRLALREGRALEASEDDSPTIPYAPDGEAQSSTTSRGTRTDVAIVASLAARLALMTLLADLQHPDTTPLPSNYLAWGAVPQREYRTPFDFRYPLSAHWVQIDRRADCPVCGDVQAESTSDELQNYEAIIASLQDSADA